MHTVILKSESQIELAKQYIDQAPTGSVMRLSKPVRSLDQNAKMWALLSAVSRTKPQDRHHTTETWKRLFMHACGHEVQFENGLDGQPFPSGFATSRLTTEQMNELIEFIYAWGSKNGVIFVE